MATFTKAFGKAYDAIRRVTMADPTSTLTLFDDAGAEIDVIEKGWLAEELIGEQFGGRAVELRITDAEGTDYSAVVFASWGGYRYERSGFPNPPTGNPQEWIWRMIPVGKEAA